MECLGTKEPDTTDRWDYHDGLPRVPARGGGRVNVGIYIYIYIFQYHGEYGLCDICQSKPVVLTYMESMGIDVILHFLT